jgi:hypothetical protein
MSKKAKKQAWHAAMPSENSPEEREEPLIFAQPFKKGPAERSRSIEINLAAIAAVSAKKDQKPDSEDEDEEEETTPDHATPAAAPTSPDPDDHSEELPRMPKKNPKPRAMSPPRVVEYRVRGTTTRATSQETAVSCPQAAIDLDQDDSGDEPRVISSNPRPEKGVQNRFTLPRKITLQSNGNRQTRGHALVSRRYRKRQPRGGGYRDDESEHSDSESESTKRAAADEFFREYELDVGTLSYPENPEEQQQNLADCVSFVRNILIHGNPRDELFYADDAMAMYFPGVRMMSPGFMLLVDTVVTHVEIVDAIRAKEPLERLTALLDPSIGSPHRCDLHPFIFGRRDTSPLSVLHSALRCCVCDKDLSVRSAVLDHGAACFACRLFWCHGCLEKIVDACASLRAAKSNVTRALADCAAGIERDVTAPPLLPAQRLLDELAACVLRAQMVVRSTSCQARGLSPSRPHGATSWALNFGNPAPVFSFNRPMHLLGEFPHALPQLRIQQVVVSKPVNPSVYAWRLARMEPLRETPLLWVCENEAGLSKSSAFIPRNGPFASGVAFSLEILPLQDTQGGLRTCMYRMYKNVRLAGGWQCYMPAFEAVLRVSLDTLAVMYWSYLADSNQSRVRQREEPLRLICRGLNSLCHGLSEDESHE